MSRSRTVPPYAWPKVHWLAVNTRMTGYQIAAAIGISQAYVSIILREYRSAGVTTPNLWEEEKRGDKLFSDMPVIPELPPTTEASSTPEGRIVRKAERTKYSATDSALSKPDFDPKAHYESRHYKGKFEL